LDSLSETGEIALHSAHTYDTGITNEPDNLRVVAELGRPVKESESHPSIAEVRLDLNQPVTLFCVSILLGLS